LHDIFFKKIKKSAFKAKAQKGGLKYAEGSNRNF